MKKVLLSLLLSLSVSSNAFSYGQDEQYYQHMLEDCVSVAYQNFNNNVQYYLQDMNSWNYIEGEKENLRIEIENCKMDVENQFRNDWNAW